MKEVNPKQYEEITSRIPAGRWGRMEDLQGLAVFLASDASAYISGAVIPVDGGFMGKVEGGQLAFLYSLGVHLKKAHKHLGKIYWDC